MLSATSGTEAARSRATAEPQTADRRNKVNAISAAISQSIQTGAIAPGSRIKLVEKTREYGITMQTMVKVMRALAARGLVLNVHRMTWHVTGGRADADTRNKERMPGETPQHAVRRLVMNDIATGVLAPGSWIRRRSIAERVGCTEQTVATALSKIAPSDGVITVAGGGSYVAGGTAPTGRPIGRERIAAGKLTQIADTIRRSIQDGRIAPGSRIHVEDIAADEQVKKGVILRAVRMLAEEGYVNSKNGYGSFATPAEKRRPRPNAKTPDAVTDAIEAEIRARNLQPGAVLDVVQLATAHGTSETRIRLAAIDLAHRGIVTLSPPGIATVAQPVTGGIRKRGSPGASAAWSPETRRDVVARIAEDIDAGIMAPGEQIHIRDLATRLETSTGTLQRVLRKLATAGIIRIDGFEGTFVAGGDGTKNKRSSAKTRADTARRAEQAVRSEVTHGLVKPGQPIRHEDLAQRLGISLKAAKKGLRRLAQEKVLENVGSKGYFLLGTYKRSRQERKGPRRTAPASLRGPTAEEIARLVHGSIEDGTLRVGTTLSARSITDMHGGSEANAYGAIRILRQAGVLVATETSRNRVACISGVTGSPSAATAKPQSATAAYGRERES